MRRWHCLAITLFAVLSAARAEAYVRSHALVGGTPVSWPRTSIQISLSSSVRIPGVSVDRVQAAVAEAAARWNRAIRSCSDIHLEISGNKGTDRVANDQVNTLIIRKNAWCRNGNREDGCHDPGINAMTSVHVKDSVIEDTDIELNGVNWWWKVDAVLASTSQTGVSNVELTGVLTHEFGHVLGLAHTCSEDGTPGLDHLGRPIPRCDHASPAIQATAMYPASPLGRLIDISPDEVDAICTIYPRPTRWTWPWIPLAAIVLAIGGAVVRRQSRLKPRPAD